MERVQLSDAVLLCYRTHSLERPIQQQIICLRVEMNPVENLELAMRDDIWVEPIDVNIQPSGVAEEEEDIYIDPRRKSG